MNITNISFFLAKETCEEYYSKATDEQSDQPSPVDAQAQQPLDDEVPF